MSFPLVQFVSAADPSAGVRFDFNTAGEWPDDETWPEHDGFSLGAPTLEGSADSYNVEYGLRQLTFNLVIRGSKQAAAERFSALARELVRRRNWLQFQMSPFESPVWFRTHRTAPGAASFEWVMTDRQVNLWGVSVVLDAEPFASGERISLSPVTFGNNPATGGCLYGLPDILGDAPAPLRVRVSGDYRGDTALLSVLASDVAPTGQVVATPGAFGTDTSSVSNAGAIGGTAHSVSFASNPGLVSRLGYSGPADLRHGKYKALMRVAVDAGSFRAQLRWATQPLTDVTFSTAAAGTWFYQELGEFDWPPGGCVEDEFLESVASDFSMALIVQRVSGVSAMLVDALVLVPVAVDADVADTLMVTFPTSAVASDAMFVDGGTESVRVTASGDVPVGVSVDSAKRGGFPTVTPGKLNVVRYFQTVRRDGGGGDAFSSSAQVTFSYQPAILYMGSA